MSHDTRTKTPVLVAVVSLVSIAAFLLAGSQLISGDDATTAVMGASVFLIIGAALDLDARSQRAVVPERDTRAQGTPPERDATS